MANKVLVQEMDSTPEQICFRDATDFGPTAANDLRVSTPTLVQLDLTDLADGAYWQSTQADLGENRALSYSVRAAFELDGPVAGDAIYLHFAPSSSATPGTGNSGGASGADGTYVGYDDNPEQGVMQMFPTLVFTCADNATTVVQVAECGVFYPTQRYVSVIVQNESGDAFFSDMDECHIVLNPIVPEVQS